MKKIDALRNNNFAQDDYSSPSEDETPQPNKYDPNFNETDTFNDQYQIKQQQTRDRMRTEQIQIQNQYYAQNQSQVYNNHSRVNNSMNSMQNQEMNQIDPNGYPDPRIADMQMGGINPYMPNQPMLNQ